MSDLDELPGQLTELRDLIREAHAAVKDMTRLLAELREVSAGAAAQARAAAQQAATAEMTRFQDHIQAQMDAHAKNLNRAVEAARGQVVRALTVTSLEERPGGGLRVTFAGNLFDDGEAG